MARFCPLFSGSSGNCTYIGTSAGAFLVDAGVSYKALTAALKAIGSGVEELCGVAVTHEHTDHVKGLRLLLKNTDLPVIASEETLRTLEAAEVIPEKTRRIVAGKETLDLCGVGLTRFATSHDCAGSSGYVFTLPDRRRIAVCTDLGVMQEPAREALTGCTLVLIESNHDIDMLKKGPYPPALKLRILSETGHLSNNACAAELPALLKSGTTRFVLGHLSRQNNLPMLAASSAKATLMDVGAADGTDYLLSVAMPDHNAVTLL